MKPNDNTNCVDVIVNNNSSKHKIIPKLNTIKAKSNSGEVKKLCDSQAKAYLENLISEVYGVKENEN